MTLVAKARNNSLAGRVATGKNAVIEEPAGGCRFTNVDAQTRLNKGTLQHRIGWPAEVEAHHRGGRLSDLVHGIDGVGLTQLVASPGQVPATVYMQG
jgi:hypothetical protein